MAPLDSFDSFRKISCFHPYDTKTPLLRGYIVRPMSVTNASVGFSETLQILNLLALILKCGGEVSGQIKEGKH